MKNSYGINAPYGRLIPVFCPHDGLDVSALTNALARVGAMNGETVLMIDASPDCRLMRETGIIFHKTLGDVLHHGAKIGDAKYVSYNDHYSICCAGDASLEDLLGSMAALSLGYDWVFVVCAPGCTPAHVCLAAAADTALMAYDGTGDHFMRAYWMLDAIRSRAPKFDPLMVVYGDETDGFESYDMLHTTVHDFLGAPPALGGLMESQDAAADIAPSILEALRSETTLKSSKAS